MTDETGKGGRAVGKRESDTAPGAHNARTYRSEEIFADAREVIIEHGGEHYRLRATRKGKLILTK